MKPISQKVVEVINKESSKFPGDNRLLEIEQLISEMKKSGLLKEPTYNFPLVDTLGKHIILLPINVNSSRAIFSSD